MLDKFLSQLDAGEVPDEYPEIMTSLELYSSEMPWGEVDKVLTKQRDLKDRCRERGMYGIVDMKWTKNLADWIGSRTAVEVMAGRGWLTAALLKHGANVVATDNKSWEFHFSLDDYITYVHQADAEEVAEESLADILIMSWPPANSTAYYVMETWGPERPIVYIGEELGGCTANTMFFKYFALETQIPMPRHYGLYDHCLIGRYLECEEKDG